MATAWAMQLAATAWCKDKTQYIQMDTRLTKAFADILDATRTEADAVISRGVEIMTTDQVGQWDGVRSFLETS